MNLQGRARATEKVLQRYRNKPFSWRGAHCIRLAQAQGKAMGHRLPTVPRISGPISARRALASQGVTSVTGLLDKYFARLPAPAFMLIGDLCVLAGADEHGGLEAVCIADGLGNLFGWHAETGFARLETIKFAEAEIAAAWRL